MRCAATSGPCLALIVCLGLAASQAVADDAGQSNMASDSRQSAEGGNVQAELQTIKQRYLNLLLVAARPSEAELAGLLQGLRADGSWPDIDYGYRDIASWAPVGHLHRLVTLGRALRHQDSQFKGDAALRGRALAALDFWLQRDPQSDNWWWNQIGGPQALAEVTLLLEEDMAAESLALALERLGRSWPTPKVFTGQNLVWVAGVGIIRGCLLNDVEIAGSAARAIAGTVVISQSEGIQPDFSFHQHGPFLYAGGYGMGFARDTARLAALLSGTSLAFTPQQVDVLSRSEERRVG